MLSKLRRISTSRSIKSISRDSGYGSTNTSANNSASNSPTKGRINEYFLPPAASLLGLPAEIRRQIFVEVAESTILALPQSRKTPNSKKSRGPDPAGLLLANRQTRREFQYLLLNLAVVEVRVHNYDFTNLIRVLTNQTDAERLALTRNDNLWIVLVASHVPTRDDTAALRKWTDFRAAQLTSGRSTPARLTPCPSIHEVNEDDEEYDEDPIAPLPSDIYPSQPQVNYHMKFTAQIRPPRPALRYSCRADMERDLLRSHLKMFARLQDEATERKVGTQELKRMLKGLQRQEQGI